MEAELAEIVISSESMPGKKISKVVEPLIFETRLKAEALTRRMSTGEVPDSEETGGDGDSEEAWDACDSWGGDPDTR